MLKYQLKMPENNIFYDIHYVTPITFSKTESITDTIHVIYNLKHTGIAKATETVVFP
jgi:hypothetical protein